MRRSQLLQAAAAIAFNILLSACATPSEPQRPAVGVFYFDSALGAAAPDEMERLRAGWAPSAADFIAETRAKQFLIHQVQDLVAFRAATGVPPCRALQLTAAERKDLAAFPLYVQSARMLVSVQPASINEIWTVTLCGQQTRWRVFDEIREGRPEFRAVLVRSQ